MSNRERCVAMLDGFTDAQLINVAAMLQSMKQAIEEGFILDVLKNYMTYKNCYKNCEEILLGIQKFLRHRH